MENTASTQNNNTAVLRKLSKARAMVATMEWPMDGKIELGGRSIPYRSAEVIKRNINKVLTEVGLEYTYSIDGVEALQGLGNAPNRLRGTFRLNLFDIETGQSLTFAGPCEAGTNNDKASAFIHTNGYKALVSTVFGINTDDDAVADDPDKTPASKFLSQGAKNDIRAGMEAHKVGGAQRDRLFGAPKAVAKDPIVHTAPGTAVNATKTETPETPKVSEVLKANPPVAHVIRAGPASDKASDDVLTKSDKASDDVPTASDKAPISESQKKVLANTLRRLAIDLPEEKIKELEAERDAILERDDAHEANEWNSRIRSLV